LRECAMMALMKNQIGKEQRPGLRRAFVD
jgi:hypothetical protein